MIARDINQITEADLQALIDDSVLERKTLEYKQVLPGNSYGEKREFLADVSSLANASGGDIIFGITQDPNTGLPTEISGLDIANPDDDISRLDNIIRTGIQPRLPSVNIKTIPLDNSKIAILIRATKSWAAPHRVTLEGHDKFYSRSSNGKYPLDVGELRIAFNLSETITERLRNFRQDRISKIMANETPVPFVDSAKLVLHLVPISSFSTTQHYDIGIIASNPGTVQPIYSGGNERYNIDGFLTYHKDEEGNSKSYVQLYRNGIIEVVDSSRLQNPVIPSISFERELIRKFPEYVSVFKTLRVELPYLLYFDLLGVKGYSLGVSRERFLVDEINTIDRDVLQLPEVIIDSLDNESFSILESGSILKPCFDALWNACGFSKDYYYDDSGEWNPR